MQVILGDICYPKSEVIIIPANTKGIMSRGVPARIAKDGLSTITKEVKMFVTNNRVEIESCFSTGPGRLKRRGLKRIYHAVIKRLQNDFSSIFVINKVLNNVLQKVIDDRYESVAICGLGIDDGNLDSKTIARIMVEGCSRYHDKIKIKIIDDDKEFIKEVNNILKDLPNVSTK